MTRSDSERREAKRKAEENTMCTADVRERKSDARRLNIDTSVYPGSVRFPVCAGLSKASVLPLRITPSSVSVSTMDISD